MQILFDVVFFPLVLLAQTPGGSLGLAFAMWLIALVATTARAKCKNQRAIYFYVVLAFMYGFYDLLLYSTNNVLPGNDLIFMGSIFYFALVMWLFKLTRMLKD